MPFEILSNLTRTEIFSNLRKIEHEDRIYDCYYLKDVVDEYSKKYKFVALNDFIKIGSSFRVFNTEYLIKVQNDLGSSLVYKARDNIPIEKILQSKYKLDEKSEEQERVFKSPYLPNPQKNFTLNLKQKDSRNFTSTNDRLKSYGSPINSNKSTVSTQTASVKQEDKKESASFGSLISNSKVLSKFQESDEDSEDFKPAKRPKSNTNTKEIFGSIVENIKKSFFSCSVISTDLFNHTYCLANGSMFDYKTAPCGIQKHAHPNLSKYLRCVKDIELKEFRKQYLVKKDLTIPMRRYEYVSKINKGDHLFKLGIESLLVNLLAIKSTLALNDLLELFLVVYKVSFNQFLQQKTGQHYTLAEIVDFLCDIGSPNIVIVNKNGNYNVTVSPFHNSYTEFLGFDLHKQIFEKEKSLLGTQGVDNEIKNVVLTIFGKETDLLKIADLNIPKFVMTEAREEIIPVGDTWKFIMSNVAFHKSRSFF